MAEVLLLHHALGLTPGVRAFAEELRSAGHTVHAPDVYDGRTFETVDDGVAYAKQVGFEEILDRGVHAADRLPAGLVYCGMSLGVMAAQKLAMSRPGAKGAIMLYGALPLSEFGGAWPSGVPLQIHTMEEDELGDVDVAREVVKAVPGAELFLYPGNRHLFTDSSAGDYDPDAAAVVSRRVRAFLAKIR